MDATPTMTRADPHAFQRASGGRRKSGEHEAQRIEKLQTKLHELVAAVDDALDTEGRERADTLREKGGTVDEQL